MLTHQTEIAINLMIKDVKQLQKLANKNRKTLEKLIKNTKFMKIPKKTSKNDDSFEIVD